MSKLNITSLITVEWMKETIENVTCKNSFKQGILIGMSEYFLRLALIPSSLTPYEKQELKNYEEQLEVNGLLNAFNRYKNKILGR